MRRDHVQDSSHCHNNVLFQRRDEDRSRCRHGSVCLVEKRVYYRVLRLRSADCNQNYSVISPSEIR